MIDYIKSRKNILACCFITMSCGFNSNEQFVKKKEFESIVNDLQGGIFKNRYRRIAKNELAPLFKLKEEDADYSKELFKFLDKRDNANRYFALKNEDEYKQFLKDYNKIKRKCDYEAFEIKRRYFIKNNSDSNIPKLLINEVESLKNNNCNSEKSALQIKDELDLSDYDNDGICEDEIKKEKGSIKISNIYDNLELKCGEKNMLFIGTNHPLSYQWTSHKKYTAGCITNYKKKNTKHNLLLEYDKMRSDEFIKCKYELTLMDEIVTLFNTDNLYKSIDPRVNIYFKNTINEQNKTIQKFEDATDTEKLKMFNHTLNKYYYKNAEILLNNISNICNQLNLKDLKKYYYEKYLKFFKYYYNIILDLLDEQYEYAVKKIKIKEKNIREKIRDKSFYRNATLEGLRSIPKKYLKRDNFVDELRRAFDVMFYLQAHVVDLQTIYNILTSDKNSICVFGQGHLLNVLRLLEFIYGKDEIKILYYNSMMSDIEGFPNCTWDQCDMDTMTYKIFENQNHQDNSSQVYEPIYNADDESYDI